MNDEESLDKMKTLRQNMVKAYEVHEWLTRREARKVQIVVRPPYHVTRTSRKLNVPGIRQFAKLWFTSSRFQYNTQKYLA